MVLESAVGFRMVDERLLHGKLHGYMYATQEEMVCNSGSRETVPHDRTRQLTAFFPNLVFTEVGRTLYRTSHL